MSLSDLTDTYWKWNDYEYTGTLSYTVNITTRDNLLTSSTLYAPFKRKSMGYGWYEYYYASEVMGSQTYYVGYFYATNEPDETGWGYMWETSTGFTPEPSNTYRYFYISGGKDATNATLISYLLQHATQCNSSWKPL